MAQHYTATGFVFKKEDWLEADRVFSVFTKEFGRLEVFGKAIRKIASKLKGGIEIFHVCQLEFVQGKTKKTLTDALALQTFKTIPTSPEKAEIAYRIASLLEQFIKGEQKDEHILELITDAFVKLNNSPARQLVHLYFFWNFVAVLGYGPQVTTCVSCAQILQPANLSFSIKEGGVVCRNCAATKKDAEAIQPEAVTILRLILKKEWETLARLKMEKSVVSTISRVSESYKQHLLGTIR